MRIRESLGDGSWLNRTAPSVFGNSRSDALAKRYERLSLTPGACYSEGVKFGETDIRPILSSIHVPTLVLQRQDDHYTPVEGSRYIADKIKGARLEVVEGDDHMPWAGNQDAVCDLVLSFVASVHDEESELERSLTTVLITDIVNSTETAIELGDQRWQEIRSQHDRVVRAQLARYRGREIKTLGDGFLAIFDGPARGARCAKAIADSIRDLGIEIRAGVHIGEIMLEDSDVSGLGVVICERIASLAGPSEVLVSSTIRDLVSGSKLQFQDAGSHRLKGLDDPWQIFRVSS